jgi:4-alpha-glucanotransferase
VGHHVRVPELTQELLDVAAAYGVVTEYDDWRGNHVHVSVETIVAVLAAMDVDASTPEAAARARREQLELRWRRMLPACVTVQQGAESTFWVHVPHGEPVEVWLELETGESRREVTQVDHWVEPCRVDGRLVGEATFAVPEDLPLGYHTIRARCGDTEASTTLIVTPPFLGLPERMGARRGWGYATQLYSVRSARSWGVGDLVDLTDLAVWSGAEQGSDFVLVNPLHAAEPVAPMEPSPYLPTSRRFFNPLYLRVERIPEYADLPRAEQAKVTRRFNTVRRKAEHLDAIDRDTAWTAKREALQLVHAVPRTAGREADYRAFQRREGDALEDFATWSALAEVHGNDFRSWPAELRDPSSDAVARFKADNAEAVEFHAWLQWLLDEQLQLAQAKAINAGMSIGVMHDLAVGVSLGGADAWRLQDTYAQGMQVGAPPDDYNQMGQDWGQPPWRPDRLAEVGYTPFRELLSGVLRHAGGVRVDHIIGLFRLWWVPEGKSPAAGTYVRDDHEALVGILALEAYRAGAVVVGEDLGTVAPTTRDYLRGRGILGTSILWFERDESGAPLAAEKWRELCLASVTTHDLPPTAGYLESSHVYLRERLGLLTQPVEEELAADEKERAAWISELSARGLLADGGSESVEETVQALHRYLTQTPARLLCVSLADAVGDRRAQNQPGTSNEYPNWRVPLAGPDEKPLMLEEVFTSRAAASLAEVVRGES